MAGGRPLKFKDIKKLRKAIEAYFDSCWEPVMDHRLTAEARQLKEENPGYKPKPTDYEWVQETDWQGKLQFRQIRPYTITGLALALGTSRQTLVNYEGRGAFFDAIKEAKLRCENYVEEGLFKGDVPPAPGIFNLKNNYEWKDEQHTTHDVDGTLADLLREVNDSGRKTSKKNT
jgi:hypothetical protein